MKEEINTFLDYLIRDKGLSKNTISAYRGDLYQMLAYFEGEVIKRRGSSVSRG